MTLTTWNTAAITSNVLFEAWALQVHTAILATGLVQTADTGQIVFSTAVYPGVANTKAGYAMYAFNDPNQGSYPCFIRVDFGTATAATYPSLWVQVGTSTNGAGVIGGIQTSQIQTQETGAGYISGISGSSSRLTMALSYNNGTPAYDDFLSIERIQTVSGTDSTTGLVFTWVKSYAGSNTYISNGQQVLYFTGTQPVANYSATSGIPTIFANTSNTSTTWTNGGNNSYVGLIYPVGQIVHYPIQGFMVNYPGDISPFSVVTIPIYGTTHSWISIPVGCTTNLVTNGGASQMSLLVRWD